jgi:hypothetical protein
MKRRRRRRRRERAHRVSRRASDTGGNTNLLQT